MLWPWPYAVWADVQGLWFKLWPCISICDSNSVCGLILPLIFLTWDLIQPLTLVLSVTWCYGLPCAWYTLVLYILSTASYWLWPVFFYCNLVYYFISGVFHIYIFFHTSYTDIVERTDTLSQQVIIYNLKVRKIKPDWNINKKKYIRQLYQYHLSIYEKNKVINVYIHKL